MNEFSLWRDRAERAERELSALRVAAQELVNAHARRHPQAGFWTLNERSAMAALTSLLDRPEFPEGDS